jgi:hypothetical protein
MLKLEEIPGVGNTTAKRLRDAGFTNLETIAVTPARELKEKAGYEDLDVAERIVGMHACKPNCRQASKPTIEKHKFHNTTALQRHNGISQDKRHPSRNDGVGPQEHKEYIGLHASREVRRQRRIHFKGYSQR